MVVIDPSTFLRFQFSPHEIRGAGSGGGGGGGGGAFNSLLMRFLGQGVDGARHQQGGFQFSPHEILEEEEAF